MFHTHYLYYPHNSLLLVSRWFYCHQFPDQEIRSRESPGESWSQSLAAWPQFLSVPLRVSLLALTSQRCRLGRNLSTLQSGSQVSEGWPGLPKPRRQGWQLKARLQAWASPTQSLGHPSSRRPSNYTHTCGCALHSLPQHICPFLFQLAKENIFNV